MNATIWAAIIAGLATIIAAYITVRKHKPKSKNDDRTKVSIPNSQKTNPQRTSDDSPLAVLSQQLYQCTILTSFIPTWLMAENRFDAIPANASDDELEIISTQLLQFIFSSIEDHFSAEFFKTSYDKIPTIEAMIENFRERIQDFYKNLQSATKSRDLMKISWGAVLKGDLFQLRVDVLRIKEAAAKLHAVYLAEMVSISKHMPVYKK